MKRILILEPDKQYATRLFEALISAGDYAVASVSTMREACLLVAQQKQDVALIPPDDGEDLIHSLRSLQSDLRLIVVVPDAGYELPPSTAERVQGTLAKSRVYDKLPQLLEEVMVQPVPVAEEAARPVSEATLTASLQGTVLDEFVLTALLSREQQLLVHTGTLDEQQAGRIVQRVTETWDPAHTAQVQFIRLPSRANDLLLYTQPIAGSYLLTLVAQPDVAIGQLRHQANKLAAQVDGRQGRGSGIKVGEEASGPAPASTSYAIVWQPKEPFPDALRKPLRRALERTAEANACVLSHVEIGPASVQIVVSCLPGRNSAWAAHIFKQGTEKAIQEAFGVEAHLWQKGYFAAESAKPLDEADLSLFLEHL
ncbi:MAG TPA: hypothetical protein VE553_02270 [Candidatus Binatia bacterium]|nr:hypothetical protein [Candidatus Binatia bacterium]